MDADFTALRELGWHKVRLCLRNTRNVYAREHPLAIFDAVFKRSAQFPGRETDVEFVFHPDGYALPDRIGKDREYPLELIFFNAEEASIRGFLDNLQLHLQDRRNNFDVLLISEPVRRRVEDLEREKKDIIPAGCDETCMEFLTPFPFTPRSGRRGPDWRIFLDRDQFFGILLQRVIRAFRLEKDAFADMSWQEYRILPWFWEYCQFGHRPKSNDGDSEYINGTMGPLYVKGPVERIRPLLLLLSEINAGSSPGKGRGYFVLRADRPLFDDRLRDIGSLRRTCEALERESDLGDDVICLLAGPDDMLREVQAEVLSGGYRPAPFHGHLKPKGDGGTRLIAGAAPRDHLVQRTLLDIIGPVFDRMFEECSIAFRRGRSRDEARSMVAAAVRGGCTHVLESDIETFFDAVDWEILHDKLRNALPTADRITLGLLEAYIKARVTVDGREQSRQRGLIQGMVLSPLLANLYLDSFDEEMTALGHRLVRYGDDFLVLARGAAEAERAKKDAETILGRLGLHLKGEKTRITAFDAGFSFLGFDFGPGMDEEFIEKTTLRKAVFVRNLYAFVGIDVDTLIIRKGGKLIARFPFNRIGEVVIFGDNTVSSRLLHRCSRGRIPVSFCQAGGRYVNTLKPDSEGHFAVAFMHARRFDATPPEERLAVARRVVEVELAGYLAWFSGRYGAQAGEVCSKLRSSTESLRDAEAVEEVLGMEGDAVGRVYEFVRTLVKDPYFRMGPRRPREKRDPFNVLIDFASSLFFSRLNVLLRAQGLNPYLGFLHSHKDHFESLVCDLQEPFRARMIRFVLRTVNNKIVRPEHFEVSPTNDTYALTRDGIGNFLEAFEREMNLRLEGDAGTLKQLLVAQVQAVRRWAFDGGNILFYRPSGSGIDRKSVQRPIGEGFT